MSQCRTGNDDQLAYQDNVEKFLLRSGSKRRSIRKYICRLHSSLVTVMDVAACSQAMNPFRTGKLVLFQVQYDRDWHFFELGFFILIGVFGVSLLSPSSVPPPNTC